ncbi:DNA ligase-1 [Bradyrhizobium ottawaense]
MNRFAELLDRLAYEPGRNNKLRLLTGYFREVGDPDRGYALAALTGALSFKHAKPALIRDLIASRTDPVLFGLSYDYVGDLSETVALMWPKTQDNAQSFPGPPSPPPSPTRGEGAQRSGALSASTISLGDSQSEGRTSFSVPSPLVGEGQGGGYSGRDADESRHARNHNNPPPPALTEVVTTLRTLGKTELPKQLERWLDELDETGRWALLKLVTGALRIGISARLAKTAAAALGDKDPHEVELIWPGLAPPYLDLFAWLEGRGEKPVNRDPAPFRPVMLAHAIEDSDFAALDPADYIAEWKWDGIRVQAVAGRDERGHTTARLYSRTGEDITGSFPDLVPSLRLPGAIDGELLILREGRVQSFNVLQQRLNRKVVSPKLIKEFPIHLRAYDLLGDDENDLRELPFAERRERLETFIKKLGDPRIDLSPTVAFSSWEALTAARADPASAGAGEDADAVEGVMLKRRDAPYLPGRPKGPVVEVETRSAHHRCRSDVCAARSRQALVLLFRLHVRRLDRGRGRRRTGAGRQGLFRLHGRGAAADRPLRPPQHHGEVRPRPPCRARGRKGLGAGGGVRGPAALAATQIRCRHALPPHQPPALGQAAARGRSAGDAGEDAEGGRGGGRGVRCVILSARLVLRDDRFAVSSG